MLLNQPETTKPSLKDFISHMIALSQPHQDLVSTGIKPCKFTTDISSLKKGICTHYGACRIMGADYMYQGGCGKASRWGRSQLEGIDSENSIECFILVHEEQHVSGVCTRSSHCWAKEKIKFLHKKCNVKR